LVETIFADCEVAHSRSGSNPPIFIASRDNDVKSGLGWEKLPCWRISNGNHGIGIGRSKP
jgi:hypothetical protein